MLRRNGNMKKISRRKFFEKTLPLFGLALISINPILGSNVTSCNGGCTSTCQGLCAVGCTTACKGTCDVTCGYGCKAVCKDICEVTCMGTCAGSAQMRSDSINNDSINIKKN